MTTPCRPPPTGPGKSTVRRGRIYMIAGLTAVAVLLFGAAAAIWSGFPEPPRMTVGGPFTLVDSDGRTVTDKTFRGKYLLVYFGYTFCPDVCPTTLGHVADAMDRLGAKADRVTPIFITVDPRRDSPAVMKQYTNAFTSRLVGLTGTPEQIATVANEYRVYYAEHCTGPGPEDCSMDHSSLLKLMGTDGAFVTVISSEDSGEQIAAKMTKFIR